MGAWGPALYSDDFAIDVRDIYKELLGDGYNNEDVTNTLIEIFKAEIEDEEDGPVVNLLLDQYWHTAWKMFDEDLRRRNIL